MADTWTRHERPDGHRSLWFKAMEWITIEIADCVPFRLWVTVGNDCRRFYLDPTDMDDGPGWHGCPIPTAADLAWLRGE